MTYIGIDPGLTGAIAAIDENRQEGPVLEIYDMPTRPSGSKGKRELDTHQFKEIVGSYYYRGDYEAVIEKQQAMPGQGTVSMFRLGYHYGALTGILETSSIPFTAVHPRTWKKDMLRDMGPDKDASRARAIQMFPKYADQFRRKKDHGRAEAALMAAYCKRISRASNPLEDRTRNKGPVG